MPAALTDCNLRRAAVSLSPDLEEKNAGEILREEIEESTHGERVARFARTWIRKKESGACMAHYDAWHALDAV